MACCGQSNQSTPGAQPAAMAASFSLADVPDNMVLVEYTGDNHGSTLWGGPGATPSRRQYVFGADERDRVKYVDVRDVDYFINLRENTKPIFKLYEEPAQAAAPASDEGDPKVDNSQESDGKNSAMLAQDEGKPAPDGEQKTQAVNPGNMDQAPDPTVTDAVAAPLTASIVDPAKPTVTSEVKEEPAPEEAPKVAPKASHKASKK